ncbi:MAG: hypothetical protein VCE12_22235, partial [Candidatus Latescibacterota bacterium]
MLQNFKVTSYAIISCLSGLALMAVSPVFAADSAGLTVCANMGKAEQESGEMKNCFMELTRSLEAELEKAANALRSQEAVVDQAVIQSADAEGTKEALKLQIEEISGWLKDKDAKIAELEEQLSTTRSELQAKDETIADLHSQLSSF